MASKEKKKTGGKPGRAALSPAAKEERKAALAAESKSARFARLGNPRVSKAVKTIRLIGNLSGSGYEYTQAQIDAIEKILKAAVTETMERFHPSEKTSAPAIDLANIV